MMYGWGNTFGFGGLFSMLFMFAFWALIVVGIVYAVRALSANGPVTRRGAENQTEGDRALNMLRERYAKGEIDTEEFEARKRALTS